MSAAPERRRLRLLATATLIISMVGIGLSLLYPEPPEGSGAFALLAVGAVVGLWLLRPRGTHRP